MYEYRIRKVGIGLVNKERGLGKLEGSGEPGLIEEWINKFALEGWELMPIVPQSQGGNTFLLVFRRPREEQTGGEGAVF